MITIEFNEAQLSFLESALETAMDNEADDEVWVELNELYQLIHEAMEAA